MSASSLAGDDDDMREVVIATNSIRLGQFLKLADMVDVGSDVKSLLDDGEVEVNGMREVRRGRQLVRGDVVTVGGVDLRVG
jgi:ribosome-associated protein